MLKVVIIDDEYYFRSSLMNNLPWAQNGMVVVGDANDGLSGLEILQRCQPDIALVDINMPALNGLELIARARDMGICCQYIILSGYDDFKYAQQAVTLGVSNYVLKPIDYDSFLKTLNRLKHRILEQRSSESKLSELERANLRYLRDKRFNDLVNFRLAPSAQEQAALLNAHYDRYAVAVFALRDNTTHFRADSLREQLRQVDFGYAFEAFIDAKNRLAILADVRTQEQFNQLLDALMCSLNDAQGPLDVGAGRIYSQFDQVYLSYNEACMALRNHSIYPDLMRVERALGSASLIAQRKNRLRGYVRQGQAALAVQAIEEIYAQLYNAKAHYDLIVLNTLELMSLLISLLDRQGVGHEDIMAAGVNILDEMEQMKTVSEFCHWITGRYQLGIEVQRQQMDVRSVPISKVLCYIEDHLGDCQLSVASIAGSLFMNYSYICYAFKREVGLTVNEYITKQRMEKAKDMFLDGLSNVAYVAGQVGYEDANYFSKSFKKKEGVTPSEFIRMHT